MPYTARSQAYQLGTRPDLSETNLGVVIERALTTWVTEMNYRVILLSPRRTVARSCPCLST